MPKAGEIQPDKVLKEADRDCPDCGGNVLQVGYMPSVTEFVTGYKCQDCDWADDDRN